MKEKKDVGHKIMMARKTSNISQTELAKKLNRTRQTIASWENGSCIPSIKQIEELSKVFQEPISFFLQEKNDVDPKTCIPLNSNNTISLPIFATVMCGKPDFCSYTEGDYEDFVEVPLSLFPEANFIIRCQGESMIPDIPPTAYCVIKEMKIALNNKIMLVKTEDGYTIKRIVKVNDKYELHYLNPKDKIIQPKQLEIIGKVIGIWNKIG